MRIQVVIGDKLRFNDGNPAHCANCEVLDVVNSTMLVQFEDRADTTAIRLDDKAWTQYLTPINPNAGIVPAFPKGRW